MGVAEVRGILVASDIEQRSGQARSLTEVAIRYDPVAMFPFSRSAKSAFDRGKMLSACPVRLVESDLKPTEDGGARLRVKVEPRRVHRWLLRFPGALDKTFELDAIGLFVWNQCDGETSFEELINRVAAHLKISPREAEVATAAFIQTLVRKNLLGLQVPKAS